MGSARTDGSEARKMLDEAQKRLLKEIAERRHCAQVLLDEIKKFNKKLDLLNGTTPQ